MGVMTLLSIPYDVNDHRPQPFLGRHVPLPELSWFPNRHVLENPITSVQGMLEFVEGTAFFAPGYDQKLDKAHWGVWQARQLEAAWWRLQDACSPSPHLPHGFAHLMRAPHYEGPPIEGLQLYLDSYSSAGRAWLRHMGITFLHGPAWQGPDPGFLDLPREEPWPKLPEDKQILGLPGAAERQAFWWPLSAYSVSEALNGMSMVRFGKRKFFMPVLPSLDCDPSAAFEVTFGRAAGAALAQWQLEQRLPSASALSVPRARI